MAEDRLGQIVSIFKNQTLPDVNMSQPGKEALTPIDRMALRRVESQQRLQQAAEPVSIQERLDQRAIDTKLRMEDFQPGEEVGSRGPAMTEEEAIVAARNAVDPNPLQVTAPMPTMAETAAVKNLDQSNQFLQRLQSQDQGPGLLEKFGNFITEAPPEQGVGANEVVAGALVSALPGLIGSIFSPRAAALAQKEGGQPAAEFFVKGLQQREKTRQEEKSSRSKLAIELAKADRIADEKLRRDAILALGLNVKSVDDIRRVENDLRNSGIKQEQLELDKEKLANDIQETTFRNEEARKNNVAKRAGQRAKAELDRAKAANERKFGGKKGGAGKIKPSERLAAGFARRLQQVDSVFDKLKTEGFDRTEFKMGVASAAPPWLLKGLGVDERTRDFLGRQDQAERNFCNATLRRESGAAIAASEFENCEVQYFPRAGDTQNVLAQKKENRRIIREQFEAEAGQSALSDIGATRDTSKPVERQLSDEEKEKEFLKKKLLEKKRKNR